MRLEIFLYLFFHIFHGIATCDDGKVSTSKTITTDPVTEDNCKCTRTTETIPSTGDPFDENYYETELTKFKAMYSDPDYLVYRFGILYKPTSSECVFNFYCQRPSSPMEFVTFRLLMGLQNGMSVSFDFPAEHSFDYPSIACDNEVWTYQGARVLAAQCFTVVRPRTNE